MSDDSHRIADLESKVNILIESQESITKHIDETLSRLKLVAEEKLNTLVPIGTLLVVAGDTPLNLDDSILLTPCEGGTDYIGRYPELFAVIGHKYTPASESRRDILFGFPNISPVNYCPQAKVLIRAK